MRTILSMAAALVFVGVAGAREGALTVSSSAFGDGGQIPAEYTCEGRGTPPPISWAAVPPGTKSIAVIVEDPDAPGGTFDHLAAFNLPPTQSSLPSTALGSLGQPGTALSAARNSSGSAGFAPICPPSGRHHYRFIVSALDTTLQLGPNAPASAVKDAMNGHVLARGVLTGTFAKR